jgi:hypothetical protein
MQIKRLGDLCDIEGGVMIEKDNIISGEYELVGGPYAQNQTHNAYNASENTIVLSKLGYPLHKYTRECISIYKKKIFVTYLCCYLTNVKPVITTNYLLYSLKGNDDEMRKLYYRQVIDRDELKNFPIEIPPIHLQEMRPLKAIYKAKKRLRRLIFCDELQGRIDEFRYRPDGDGYKELREKNSGLWADL